MTLRLVNGRAQVEPLVVAQRLDLVEFRKAFLPGTSGARPSEPLALHQKSYFSTDCSARRDSALKVG